MINRKFAIAIAATGKRHKRVAADAGLNDGQLSLILNGRRCATLAEADSLARVLGVDASELDLEIRQELSQ